MPRAIWSGSISFGLLNVPVKLYSAVSKQNVRFRELREGDGSPTPQIRPGGPLRSRQASQGARFVALDDG